MRWVLLLFLLLVPTLAAAQQANVGLRVIDLMWDCQGKGGFYNLAVKHKMPDPSAMGASDLVSCGSYISGMSDMAALHKALFGRSAYCFPRIKRIRVD